MSRAMLSELIPRSSHYSSHQAHLLQLYHLSNNDCLKTKRLERSKDTLIIACLWFVLFRMQKLPAHNSWSPWFWQAVVLFIHLFFFTIRSLTNLHSSFMAALTKVQRAKASAATKTAMLNKFVNARDIPKWSEMGTHERNSLREAVISQLQITDNGDVAEYLKLHESKLDGLILRRVPSLRDQRNTSEIWNRHECNCWLTTNDRSLVDHEKLPGS